MDTGVDSLKRHRKGVVMATYDGPVGIGCHRYEVSFALGDREIDLAGTTTCIALVDTSGRVVPKNILAVGAGKIRPHSSRVLRRERIKVRNRNPVGAIVNAWVIRLQRINELEAHVRRENGAADKQSRRTEEGRFQ